MRKLIGAAVAGLCVALGAGAHAAVQLDQTDIPQTGYILLPFGGPSLTAQPNQGVFGQTFTAGLTGRLTQVDLAIVGSPYLTEPGGFTIRVEQTPGVALATTHVDLSAVPHKLGVQWTDIPQISLPGGGVPVTANSQYRIVLTTDPGTLAFGTGWLDFVNGALVSYAGGYAFTINQYGEFPFNQGGIDFAFRTYVDTSVPEPATWTMMLLGVGALGGRARARRRQRIAASRAIRSVA